MVNLDSKPSRVRLVLAPDKFKGSLSAVQVTDNLAAGLTAGANVEVIGCPVADGGEGTVEAALAAGYRPIGVRVAGPLGNPVDAVVAIRGDEAVVELATASGLGALGGHRPNCLAASSFGTGQLVGAALDAGCRRIVLGVGGSACTDGGAGMLQALGADLRDGRGERLEPGGAALNRLAHVDLGPLDPRVRGAEVVLACDVDNPLTGPRGAAAVYGPQKGASAEDVALLDHALDRWARLLRPTLASAPGAGAAGGVGFGAMAGLGARRRSGIAVMMELTGLHNHVTGAALVVTGEGQLDLQTLSGKAVMGVTRAARAVGVPAVAVCGISQLTRRQAHSVGLSRVFGLTELEPNVDRSMACAPDLLRLVAAQILAWLGRERAVHDGR
jgi:glycerate 2-kinase